MVRVAPMLSRAEVNSRHDAYRSSRFFPKAAGDDRHELRRQLGAKRFSGSASRCEIRYSVSLHVAPWKGGRPVSSSYSITPKAKTSLRASMSGRPCACSGDM